MVNEFDSNNRSGDFIARGFNSFVLGNITKLMDCLNATTKVIIIINVIISIVHFTSYSFLLFM